jgi:hypothetical protein
MYETTSVGWYSRKSRQKTCQSPIVLKSAVCWHHQRTASRKAKAGEFTAVRYGKMRFVKLKWLHGTGVDTRVAETHAKQNHLTNCSFHVMPGSCRTPGVDDA